MIDSVCFIANATSPRFPYLQQQVSIIQDVCSDISYIYKYSETNIDTEIYKKYYGLLPYNRRGVLKLSYQEPFTVRAFAVVLNHLECFKHISTKDPNGWSLICEDDIVINSPDSFKKDISLISTDKPANSDILWISSGKRNVDCTYKNITGQDPDPKINYNQNQKYCRISESRYADCVLIKNNIVSIFLKNAEEYKISYAIDWEYNFWLKINPYINSYWVQPALIKQNPQFFANGSL